MSEPVGGGQVQQPPDPVPAVVEWGTEPRRRLDLFTGLRWHPALPWVLAWLGAVALFGSLVGEWQVASLDADLAGDPGGETVVMGVGEILSWGAAWLVGALLLAATTGLALVGQPTLRPAARSLGLILAGILLGFLVAAAIALNQRSLLMPYWVGIADGIEVRLGRGVHAAFASLVLLGAALYLVRVPTRTESGPEHTESGPERADSGPGLAEDGEPALPRPPGQRAAREPERADRETRDPPDLSVAPAEPFSHLTDEQEWR